MSIARMRPGIVAIPAQEYMPTLAVSAIVRLAAIGLPPGSQCWLNSYSCTIAKKRNHLVRAFLQDQRFGWILQLDSDMQPPADTAFRLLAHNQPIVGALYRQKLPPYKWCAARADNGPITLGGLEPVETLGTGCLLIRRHVLETISEPWFEANAEDVLEDVKFCQKATAAGFPVFVDTTLEVGHLTVVPIDSEIAMGRSAVESERSMFGGARGVELLRRVL